MGSPSCTRLCLKGLVCLLGLLPALTVCAQVTHAIGSEIFVEFTGTIYPKRFTQVQGEPAGHHAIVWKGGRTADRALIVADIPDDRVAATLAAKGIHGGNNLDAHTWDARSDQTDPAADERVEGASLEVWVEWEGSGGPHRLSEILGLPDADYRFGDHRSLIPVWRSGCIVCNVSCPGGKISNRALTVRDQFQGRLHPHLHLAGLPADGTAAKVKVTTRPIAPTPD